MKRNAQIVFMTLVLVTTAYADPMAVETCSNWAPEDWDIFIDKVVLGNMPGESTVNFSNRIVEAEKTCPRQMTKLNIDACVSRIKNYSKIFNNDPQNSNFSYLMSDDKYYATQPAAKMEIPTEFQNSPGGLPSNWRQTAEKNGWKWTLFESSIGYPQREKRLVMVIPGDGYKQLLMYYTKPGSEDPEAFVGLQMQTIEEKVDGKLLDQPKVHFRSWNFEGEDRQPALRHSGEEKCVMCHTSGPRAIVIPKEAMFQTQFGPGTTLSQLNDQIVIRDKTPDYSSIYDLNNFPVNLKVGETQGCTQCHDGKTRNSLSYLVSMGGMFDLQNIVHQKVVVEKTMPAASLKPISAEERKKMPEAILRDHSVQLKKWLTENKCAAGATPVRPDSKKVNQSKPVAR